MPRKLPERTCLGCQALKPKRDMIRIVRTPDGVIEVDPTGKKSGRGAYVCPNLECLELLRKGKRLERVLEVAPLPSFYDQLKDHIGELNREPRR